MQQRSSPEPENNSYWGMPVSVVLLVLGMVGGFLSGLLGLGGTLVMIPLLLSVPQLLGYEPLSMKTIAGLSMVQVFFSSVSALVIHNREKCVDRGALLRIGIPMGLCSFAGAWFSRFFGERLLLAIFGVMVVVALVMLLFPPAGSATSNRGAKVCPCKAMVIGAVVGFLSGVVGAGGGFVLIPLMVSVLHMPLRVTIGTSLGVVALGATMGAVGKIASLQVTIAMAVPLAAGSLICALAGARLSHRAPPALLRGALMVVVVYSGVQAAWRFFF